MQVVFSGNENVLSILKKFNKKTLSSRPFHFCTQTPVEEGVLLFNLLTKEVLLLSQEEFDNQQQLDYLKEHWFLVPEDTKDKEYVDLVRWMQASRQNKDKAITKYTIFTTTDCNARCFYCFELGRSRIPMSHETALKVVEYIKAHCNGKSVSISWFGGEPLYNMDVIDTICDGLRREGIDFQSSMVSNGYLFDEVAVQKAVEKWNLQRVQITLDGTEKVYNKTKAFIYKGDSPYQVVLKNMGHLLDASIPINVRLNMDLYNAEDLLQLVEDLGKRFCGKKGLAVYAHHLFKEGVPVENLHTDEEWEERGAAMYRLEEKIQQCGLRAKRGIGKGIKSNHCMADSSKAVTILPDGNIGLCEHYSETEVIGHVDREGLDSAVIANWQKRTPEIPECAECFYYPMCIKLDKCPYEGMCYQLYRQERHRKIQNAVLDQYDQWKNKTELEDADDDF